MQSPATPSPRVILLNEVDSTNNYATRLISTRSAEEGTVVLTFRQTQGRGHGKNVWESAENQNLTFSMVLYPTFLPASRQFLLSQAVSLGITGFLKNHTGDVKIKWPNDIMSGGKKMAGILIEHTVMNTHLHASIAGIGLNVNQTRFPSHLPHATSLAQVCGKEFHLMEVLHAITGEIMNWYQLLREGKEHMVRRHYLEQLFRLGVFAPFRDRQRIFKAVIRGTDEFGQLLLEEQDGIVTAWPFKSLEMIL